MTYLALAVALFFADTSITSTRIGQAFRFPQAVNGMTLTQDDLSLDNAENTNLTVSSGSVVYSAIDGYVERFGALHADAGCESMTNAVLACPFGSPSSRDFKGSTTKNAIRLDAGEYANVQQRIADDMDQTVASYRYVVGGVTNIAYYSGSDSLWCLPMASHIGDLAWSPVGSTIQCQGVWGAVNEVIEDDFDGRYGATKLNEWLVTMNGHNRNVLPISENDQAWQTCGFGYYSYLDYTDAEFGNGGYIRPDETNLTRRLDRAFRFDRRLALPLFAKTWMRLPFTVSMTHDVRHLVNRRTMTAEVRDFAEPWGIESVPSFEDATPSSTATNYYETVTNMISDPVVCAIDNGSESVFNYFAFLGDIGFHVTASQQSLAGLRGNAIMLSFDDIPSGQMKPFQDVTVTPIPEGGYSVETAGPSASFACSIGWTNTYGIISASVERNVDVKIPVAATNESESTFPTPAARSVGNPLIRVEHMAVKQRVKFIADEYETDPTAPAVRFVDRGAFDVRNQPWASNATAHVRTSSTLVTPNTTSNQAAVVRSMLDECRDAILTDATGDRGPLDAENLIPLSGTPEERAYDESVGGLSGTRIHPTYHMADAICLIHDGGRITSAIVRGLTTNTWEDVAAHEIGSGKYYVKVGEGGAGSSGWGGNEPPTFGYEGQPRWWRGCAFGLFALWVEWTFGNYNWTSDE